MQLKIWTKWVHIKNITLHRCAWVRVRCVLTLPVQAASQEREESVYLPGVILYTCCKSLSYAYLWADSINASNTTIPLYVLG